MNYKSVVATRHGGPEVLKVVENELRPPATGEARVKVLAAPVSQPDVTARLGRSPFLPKVPFTPGYAVIGVVDAVGEGVTWKAGDRAAALTIYGGYSEYVYLKEKALIPVPAGVNPVEAAPLILNYLVAYQVMHRSACALAGERALVIGASGGIGTALLQLGKLAGLKMYGVASKSKHAILEEYGAVPIDYRSQNFVEVIRRAEPGGLDLVFDGMSGEDYRRGYSLLRRGGRLVGFGNPQGFSAMLRLIGRAIRYNLTPDGKSAKLYSTGQSMLNRKPFLDDWAALFRLLEEGKIRPVIARTYCIADAAEANAYFESGAVIGNVVLTG